MNSRYPLLLLAALLMAVSPELSAQDTTGVHRTVVRGTMRVPDGFMTPDAAKALGSRFVGVRLVPDSVAIRVGDTLLFDRVALLAVDSSGRVLGRLPIFNTRMPAGAAEILLFRGALGDHPGLSVMTIGVPHPFWGRADAPPPAGQLKISVHR